MASICNQRLIDEYSDYVNIFTDGAKQPETGITGFGVVVPSKNIELSRRSTDNLGVYTVEMLGVLVALKWVETITERKIVICTDSTSVLSSMRSFYSSSRQGLLFEVLQTITRIVQQGRKLKFLWVPAHIGIKGNEKADEMAKEALEKEIVEMNVSISKAEVKSVIWERVNKMWQDKWDREQKGRYLYNIQKSVKVKRVYSGQRKEESILIRLRLR